MSNRGIEITKSQKIYVWDKFVNGEESYFKDLFQMYYKEMYGYGLKLCSQPEIVKDCIQELFKTVWERRNKFDHVTTPNVYLFVSLRRDILKKLDKQKKYCADLNEIDENALTGFGIEEIIITDETRQQRKATLLEALNQLSDRQKEVIYLFFYNGMSYGEIEEILSIKRQSVCNLMHRSIETLRVLLKNEEIMRLVVSCLIAFLFFLPH